jgi:hypothetical protein
MYFSPIEVDKMAAQIKLQILEGHTSLVEVGRVEFKWVISQFREFLEMGLPIRSPSFMVKTSEVTSYISSAS